MKKKLKRILLVDDEPSILTMLAELLAGKDNEVIACLNLKEAEEACSRYKFDLVITDLKLSGKGSYEGFELISRMKNFNPDTKFMLMTGCGNGNVREEALKRGAVCCFEKPFDILGMAREIQSFGISLPQIENRDLL